MERNRKFKQTLLAIAIVLFCGGSACVSVNIGPAKVEKSSGVVFAEPTGNFKALEDGPADVAWNNSHTGSTIAFQSNCADTSDAPLESIATDLFAGFEQSKDLRNERISFDGREALDREIEGKVDGVSTRVRAIIYKKNRCSYVLTFVTLSKSLVADTANKAATNGDATQFERFAASFKAP